MESDKNRQIIPHVNENMKDMITRFMEFYEKTSRNSETDNFLPVKKLFIYAFIEDDRSSGYGLLNDEGKERILKADAFEWTSELFDFYFDRESTFNILKEYLIEKYVVSYVELAKTLIAINVAVEKVKNSNNIYWDEGKINVTGILTAMSERIDKLYLENSHININFHLFIFNLLGHEGKIIDDVEYELDESGYNYSLEEKEQIIFTILLTVKIIYSFLNPQWIKWRKINLY